MDLYTKVAALVSQTVTRQYSTSFSSASRLFPLAVRAHIYNIYGLVRVADEIVDSYHGSDKAEQLRALEKETHDAVARGFSANPIVHSFAVTAREFGISQSLTQPFFASMTMDIDRTAYDTANYERYIYGSAEVIGLMCLRVFTNGDQEQFEKLQIGACHLGAAYQKVNFLRDLAADYTELGRYYFPGSTFVSFDDTIKQDIISEIRQDFEAAQPYIANLPNANRPAVVASFNYYTALLRRLDSTPTEVIKTQRIRLPSYRKFLLLTKTIVRSKP